MVVEMSMDKAHVEFVEMAAAALLAALHFVCNFARDEPGFRKELIGRMSMYVCGRRSYLPYVLCSNGVVTLW